MAQLLELVSESGLSAECKQKVKDYLHFGELREGFMEIQAALQMMPYTKAWFEKRFMRRMEFGTAGLRDVMGVGFGAMNHITVMLATQGICEFYQRELGLEEMRKRGVVVGFDGRKNSKFFAEVVAACFLDQGIKVYLFPCVTPTPLTPFALVKYGAACGIQITASHNPKQDNGYKLYGPNGAQIVPPVDSEIAALIESQTARWPKVEQLIRYDKGNCLNRAHPLMSLVCDPYKDIVTDYMATMKRDLIRDEDILAARQTDMKIVYTAMHGVGYSCIRDILEDQLGFPSKNLFAVPEQREPDAEFSTVSFPNPEEKGALSMAMTLADKVGSSLVIANDPDADRFAAAEKNSVTGQWHQFHGDELGIILGHIMHERALARGIPAEKQIFINSAVSSSMLGRLATQEGAKFAQTMTGFKWMMNLAITEMQKGMHPCLVYEEALGYGVHMSVPDKDGISAACVWVSKACELQKQGSSFVELLDLLRQKYGYFVTQNGYFLCYEPEEVKKLFAEFRSGGKYKTSIGGYPVSRIRDVTTGYDSAEPESKCSFPVTPTSQMVTVYFENGAQVTLRTSGTEPKLKFYSEMRGTSPSVAKEELAKVMEAVEAEILQPNNYPLQRP